jgi:hypothetical protein
MGCDLDRWDGDLRELQWLGLRRVEVQARFAVKPVMRAGRYCMRLNRFFTMALS